MNKSYKRFLTIAGSDSGGGAGIQADIKTASANGCYAMSVITAITAQNTQGVSGIHVVPCDMIEKQLEAILSDIGVDAVKIGMVPTPETAFVIQKKLLEYNVKNIVLDPVIVATSGDRLISEEAITAIEEKLFPISTLVTPNIPEVKFLTGIIFENINTEIYRSAAEILFKKNIKNILIKSGHIEKDTVCDYLFTGTEINLRYCYKKTSTINTHGTGCSLSSAIASQLAIGFDLDESVKIAEIYLHEAIKRGAAYKIGNGHGPVHHFFEMWD